MKINSKITILIISIISALGAMSVLTISQSDIPIEKSSVPTGYVPSVMANSMPYLDDIMVGYHMSMTTTDISDIKDKVISTVRGTVVTIGEIEYWTDPTDTSNPDKEKLFGKNVKIPINIQVIDSKKSTSDVGEIVTVKVLGKLVDNTLYLADNTPQFEVGEEVIVHIAEDPNDIIEKDFRYVALGKYGKYKIQDSMAFNEKFPQGKSIQTALNEAR